jgi:hypothetical protein
MAGGKVRKGEVPVLPPLPRRPPVIIVRHKKSDQKTRIGKNHAVPRRSLMSNSTAPTRVLLPGLLSDSGPNAAANFSNRFRFPGAVFLEDLLRTAAFMVEE